MISTQASVVPKETCNKLFVTAKVYERIQEKLVEGIQMQSAKWVEIVS